MGLWSTSNVRCGMIAANAERGGLGVLSYLLSRELAYTVEPWLVADYHDSSSTLAKCGRGVSAFIP